MNDAERTPLHPDDQTRAQRGWDTLKQVNGAPGEAVIAGLQRVAPELARFIVEFAYGDVLSRPGLDLRTRELVTVAALTALGNARPQLKTHLHGALNVGCSREEVMETLLQMAVYAGIPAAMNGVSAAQEVFEERDQLQGEART